MCKTLTVFITTIIFGVLTLSHTTHAHAQVMEDYVSIVVPEDWVKIQSVPSEEFELAEDQKTSYKLTSLQTQNSKTDLRSYSRYVIDLKTSSAVEDKGTINVSFDPSYVKVKFHHIRIINKDGVRNVLNLNDADLFRTETDRDKLFFDGTLQFSLAIKGIKVGDRLDYSYTLHGKNPAFGEGYFLRYWQSEVLPIIWTVT